MFLFRLAADRGAMCISGCLPKWHRLQFVSIVVDCSWRTKILNQTRLIYIYIIMEHEYTHLFLRCPNDTTFGTLLRQL